IRQQRALFHVPDASSVFRKTVGTLRNYLMALEVDDVLREQHPIAVSFASVVRKKDFSKLGDVSTRHNVGWWLRLLRASPSVSHQLSCFLLLSGPHDSDSVVNECTNEEAEVR